MNSNFINLANPSVQNLIPYEPGKPIEELARDFHLNADDIIKLASNENPLGVSPLVKEAMVKAISSIHLYPDGASFEAKDAISDHVSVDARRITLGCGSDELLRLIAMAYASSGDEIIFSEYAFAVYYIASLAVGATPVIAKAKDWGYDLEAILALITYKTKIIYIANPNNPTGTYLEHEQIKSFLRNVPPNIIVVLDEAYTEYLEQVQPQETPAWIDEFPNLVVVRTFSKAYGLAGLRVGYAMANPDVTDIINRVRPPFNVNQIAQKAVIAALKDQAFIQQSREFNQKGMMQLSVGLQSLGFQYIPSKGNFIAVDIQRDGREAFQLLLKQGIIVRPLVGYKMPNHLRMTIGTEQQNASLLTALEDFL